MSALIVPGQNDSKKELADIAKFTASVDKYMPWHVSRFHPDYEFDSVQSTPVEIMERAYAFGKKEGITFIYLGRVPLWSNETVCPDCEKTVISRTGYQTTTAIQDGACPKCGKNTPGVFY